MEPMLAASLSHHTSVTIAEVGFLLIVIAGVWFAAAEILPAKQLRARRIVAGTLLAAAGVLLIIATHWGQFGG
jgi:nitrate reductase gamma subunit